MRVYRPLLPPMPAGVARRMLTIAVLSDAPFRVNPGGVPGMAETLDSQLDHGFLPCEASEFAVATGSVVTLALVPYDADDHVGGEVIEYTFTADDRLPDPDPDELGVLFLREED
jgi:hypothetical protein